MSGKLIGQVAIVTGSSSGIGQAVAIEMAKQGANIVITYHSSIDGALDTQKQIEEQTSSETIIAQLNVGNEKSVKEVFEQALKKWGHLDILVSNAGIQKDSPFIDMSLDQWKGVIETNLTGAFLCAREAAKIYIKQGVTKRSCAAGKIIFMSSVHEIIPWAGHVNYAAAKGGINMFMKSLSQELADEKIRVNSIAPGAIKTPINKDVWQDENKSKQLLELIPYKRLGVPEDISKATAWMASDDADYINGTSLFIDGGMTVYPSFDDNG